MAQLPKADPRKYTRCISVPMQPLEHQDVEMSAADLSSQEKEASGEQEREKEKVRSFKWRVHHSVEQPYFAPPQHPLTHEELERLPDMIARHLGIDTKLPHWRTMEPRYEKGYKDKKTLPGISSLYTPLSRMLITCTR